MRFKLVNGKYDDYVIIEAQTIEEAREKAKKEQQRRGWSEEDMYSIELQTALTDMSIKEKLEELNGIDEGYYWWALDVFEVPDTYIKDIEGAALYIKNNYTEELIDKKFKELDRLIREYEEEYEN